MLAFILSSSSLSNSEISFSPINVTMGFVTEALKSMGVKPSGDSRETLSKNI
jgi:hypothetical protein